MRSTMRSGQPRNISAPTITAAPSAKRVAGALPPRGLNSFAATAAIIAPMTSPTISGRRYCTTAALCSLAAPAMSRKKQAMQNPILPGLPSRVSTTAAAPTAQPVRTMPRYFFKPIPPR